jgi:hypothetical protein
MDNIIYGRNAIMYTSFRMKKDGTLKRRYIGGKINRKKNAKPTSQYELERKYSHHCETESDSGLVTNCHRTLLSTDKVPIAHLNCCLKYPDKFSGPIPNA